MTKTTFHASKLTALRRKAAKAAKLPEPVPHGWSISPVDPAAIVAVFHALRIKQGYVLRAYQCCEGRNGKGFVWAIPRETEFPAPNACPRLEGRFLRPPKPPAALDDFMDAIDGDGSPSSYMQASILAREIAEFGAVWHGCEWGRHMILSADLLKSVRNRASHLPTDRPGGDRKARTKVEVKPSHYTPTVALDEQAVRVVFYTLSSLGRETIYRHTDTFVPGKYQPTMERTELASGPGGVIS